MKILLMLFFVTFATGLFLLLAGLLRLPTLRTGRAMVNAGREKKPLSATIEAWTSEGAARLAGVIRMNEYKKARLAGTLKAAGIDATPEEWSARCLFTAGAWLLIALVFLPLFPIASVLFLVIAVLTWFREAGRPEEILREKREKIEGELYRFVSTLTQELKNGRDVLSMLERYKKNAGEDFKAELGILCADMRSGSWEAALTRFEARLASPQVSDVSRGLIGVLRGDDGAVYFQMLTRDFKEEELRRLKAKAAKIPPKIRIFSFVMLACYLATFFVIIFYEILGSLGSLF